MSGRRPLLRSPKFGDGMTSETTEESGVNVFMSALPLGIGRARKRFESIPPETNEPECIGRPKTGKRTTRERQCRHYPDLDWAGQSSRHQDFLFFINCVNAASVVRKARFGGLFRSRPAPASRPGVDWADSRDPINAFLTLSDVTEV